MKDGRLRVPWAPSILGGRSGSQRDALESSLRRRSPMSWFRKLRRLFGGRAEEEEKVDYYQEGVSLLQAGHYHEALTSFRLALRESPGDTAVLQQIAIAYTRIGMTDDAAKTYRMVLERDPKAAGAHYGLAFLYLHEGKEEEAIGHLQAFLDSPPQGPEADRHVEHARKTLQELVSARGAE